ncbi:MAG: hypothetical protein GVY13_01840, partial [Alphaproteobacteria bacterium]|nr:hypothetical protein [Alphaproteobacteria bacterium]
MRQRSKKLSRLVGILLPAMALLAGCAGADDDRLPAAEIRTLLVADEPRAALIGRDVLRRGGTAVDAAVASALAMTVTLPSRVGPGGGGACLVYDTRPDPDREFRQIGEAPPEDEIPQPMAVGFLPEGAAAGAAAPALLRGLLLLHAEYGVLRWQEHLSRAEQLARFGVPVSRALARDLDMAAAAGMAGAPALAALARGAGGRLPAEGETLERPELAASLDRLRAAGIGDLHSGQLGRQFIDGATAAGLPLDAGALQAVRPDRGPPLAVSFGSDTLLLPPQPGLGGPTMAAFWRAASAAGFRGSTAGERLDRLLAARRAVDGPEGRGTSASVVAMSRTMTVACGFTLNGLFGSGEVVRGTGLIIAPGRPDGGRAHGGLALLINAPLTTPLLAASGADSPAALASPLAALLLAGR